jgi:hypothetical protein
MRRSRHANRKRLRLGARIKSGRNGRGRSELFRRPLALATLSPSCAARNRASRMGRSPGQSRLCLAARIKSGRDHGSEPCQRSLALAALPAVMRGLEPRIQDGGAGQTNRKCLRLSAQIESGRDGRGRSGGLVPPQPSSRASVAHRSVTRSANEAGATKRPRRLMMIRSVRGRELASAPLSSSDVRSSSLC